MEYCYGTVPRLIEKTWWCASRRKPMFKALLPHISAAQRFWVFEEQQFKQNANWFLMLCKCCERKLIFDVDFYHMSLRKSYFILYVNKHSIVLSLLVIHIVYIRPSSDYFELSTFHVFTAFLLYIHHKAVSFKETNFCVDS